MKVWYRWQEKTCCVCGRAGHISKNCPEVKSYSCRGFGHVASDCSEDLQCLYYFEVGHTEECCVERLEVEMKEQVKEKEKQLEMATTDSTAEGGQVKDMEPEEGNGFCCWK